jgi:signal transduction histidine kinase/HAMP domain-containing protein
MSLARYSIGAKIFGAFIAMSVIIGVMGVAGYGVLAAAGNIAVTIFDGPLMAINYARAAQSDFIEMQLAEQRYEAAPPQAREAIVEEIAALATAFEEDLDVAAQRSLAADEKALIAQIGPLFQKWRKERTLGHTAQLQKLDNQIDEKFDLLIELNADHSFIGRRKTVTNIRYYKYAIVGFTVMALLLAGGITLYLRRRIIRPLAAAATVADRIAKGELQTPIPEGDRDETGALLNSMTVMQASIREMMSRETELRLSAENRLVDALETSREGVILVTPDGRIALANGRLKDFFPAIAADLVPGRDFNEVLGLMQTQLSLHKNDGQIDNSGHAELELADGRWLRMTGSGTSEGGSIIFLSDFTIIKEREESLRRAKREAEAANASKSRFLANMSHELRTPLNAIIGFSDIISAQLFGPLNNERYLDYSHDILRSGKHLLAVINSVLDLSKSESGKMQLDARPIDMAEVLADCVSMMREQCHAAGLVLSVSAMGEMPMYGDSAKLRQIFLNLLSNAVKFTEKGGSVSLGAVLGPETIAVTVGDTGIGMSAADVEIAFQPFGQVDNRLERKYEGTGLGLPLTKALVDLHGGTLGIDSARGAGTRVTVTLPRRRADALAEAV